MGFKDKISIRKFIVGLYIKVQSYSLVVSYYVLKYVITVLYNTNFFCVILLTHAEDFYFLPY